MSGRIRAGRRRRARHDGGDNLGHRPTRCPAVVRHPAPCEEARALTKCQGGARPPRHRPPPGPYRPTRFALAMRGVMPVPRTETGRVPRFLAGVGGFTVAVIVEDLLRRRQRASRGR